MRAFLEAALMIDIADRNYSVFSTSAPDAATDAATEAQAKDDEATE